MNRRLLFACNIIFLCLVFNGLKGQSNQQHLRDTAIVLLKQCRNFTSYSLTYLYKDHPPFSQPYHSDTIKFSYNHDPLNHDIEFSFYDFSIHQLGFIKNDSCRLYSVSGNVYSSFTIHYKPCSERVQDFIYEPLFAGDLVKSLTNDSIYNISLEYLADTIKLHLSRDDISTGGSVDRNIYIDYFFDPTSGFPIKYVDHMERNNDVQNIEYSIIKYSLKRDPYLDELLSKLFSGIPTIIPDDWLSH